MKNQDPLILVLEIILSIWQLFWKGVAIWRTAKFDQRNWFMALFILMPIPDLGLIELIYLFRFAKKRLTIREIRSWVKRP